MCSSKKSLVLIFVGVAFFHVSIAVVKHGLRNEVRNLNDDLEAIFESITNPATYKKWVRPNQRNSDALTVTVSLYIYSVAWLDEVSTEYGVDCFIYMEWKDQRLNYEHLLSNLSDDELNHPSLDVEGGIHHFKRIWTPSVYVTNNRIAEGLDTDHGVNDVVLLHIKPDGSVLMRKRSHFDLLCPMDFQDYPFDTQECNFFLQSATFSADQIELKWKAENALILSSVLNVGKPFFMTGFKLIKAETAVRNFTYAVDNTTFSQLDVGFEIKRQFAPYLIDVYLPLILFVVVSWTSFWLEITSPPARTSLGLMTMLTLVTSARMFREKLPKVSYIKSLDIYIMICICFIFASLVEFAIVNYIYNTDKRRRKKENRLKRWRAKLKSGLKSLTPRTLRKSRSEISLSSLNSNESFFMSPPATPQPSRLNSAISLQIPTERGRHLSAPNTTSPKEAISLTVPNGKFQDGEGGSHGQAQDAQKLPLTPQDIANEIDRYCRRIFPLAFLIFNAIYWSLLFI